ncbi:heparin-sulfate lyase HepC [Pedobacter ghigonis]|uniref:heparin-sulfate lyase HepC n=1 Tax=Pedobacter ghigonis TaxID=2730403 RepID=UPI00158BE682|nr:heparin-sulfate lyase HepC [Pedobacter ghigonis]
MHLKITFALCLLLVQTSIIKAQQTIHKDSFKVINLDYQGLEQVKAAVNASNYNTAAAALLTYFRRLEKFKTPDLGSDAQTINLGKPDSITISVADNALQHRFKPQEANGYFDFGKDINWQLWPVKDHEFRFQLHRLNWWLAMGLAYRGSGNEAYTKEWMLQFLDWGKKNPVGLSAETDSYVWRPLEVSARIQSMANAFSLFLYSPNFTPEFLMQFLNGYYQQADYLVKHYAAEGNHRLFEAQRSLLAGGFFPEYKDAPIWRKRGIDVLVEEIKKQVYPDGVQWELSPVYHAATIDIFVNALRDAKKAGIDKEFPASYQQTIEKMAMAFINITFPNYNQPMYGDSWLREKEFRLKQYNSWSAAFPQNPFIKYFASDRREGKKPDWLSNALTTAGFYTFRNGWDSTATILMLKASPPGEFHAQPDNGTFELWANGRNFTPDAGSFVYNGEGILKEKRAWYRQTRVHSTLTLNNENMVITKAQQQKWQTGKNLDILTYTNPSYKNLSHQRSVLFIDQKYFSIIDKAIGNATGKLGTHFQLKEDSKLVYDKAAKRVYTSYTDGNNLLIQNLNKDEITLTEEAGKVSYSYGKELDRPAFVFEKAKTGNEMASFISILYPFDGAKTPEISIKTNDGNDFEKGNINITLTINGKKNEIKATLNQ